MIHQAECPKGVIQKGEIREIRTAGVADKIFDWFLLRAIVFFALSKKNGVARIV